MARGKDRRWGPAAAVGLWLLLAAAGTAGADDWPQFRRDAARSAASRDPVALPLTDVWSQPGGPAVIAGGRVFFTTRDAVGRWLVAADAATGTRLWRQALAPANAPGLDVGPAVSQSGLVFAYDALPARGGVQQRVRTFAAATGQPLAFTAVPGLVSPIGEAGRRVFLLSCQGTPDQSLAGNWNLPTMPAGLGEPLLAGDTLVAVNLFDLFFRWSATVATGPFAARIAHPVPGLSDPTLVPGTVFSGRPLALAGGGVVVAEDGTRRFLAVMDPSAQPLWHRDVDWTLGSPAVGNGTIFIGVGGRGAKAGLLAVDAASGATRWSYAPEGLPPDSLRFPGATVSRPVNVAAFPPAAAAPGAAAGGAPVRGGGGGGSVSVRGGGGSLRGGGAGSGAGGSGRPPGGAAGGGIPVNPGAPALVWGAAPASELPPGFQGNPGLVCASGRVYAIVGSAIVALDEQSGRVVWRQPLASNRQVVSLAASRDFLFISEQTGLAAVRLEDGRPVALHRGAPPGQLALADGLLYVTGLLTGVVAHAPAERTYHLALDSHRPQDYLVLPKKAADDPGPGPEDGGPPPGSEPPPTDDPPPAPAAGPGPRRAPGPPPLADATLLRLTWAREAADVAALVRQARARVETAHGAPMLLSLDWLNKTRSALAGPGAAAETWGPAEVQAFAAACGQLAEAAQPAYFDVAPEVNVYLQRFPGQFDTILSLVRAARAAVQRAAPGTQVLVSFNAEVLRKVYGKGNRLPFGALPFYRTVEPSLAPLVAAVDAVGLTTHLLSAWVRPEDVPGDHLLSLKARLGEKPLLLTGASVELPENPRPEQWGFLRRVLHLCYWLDAAVVVYPEVIPGGGKPEFVERVRDPDHPALDIWRDVLAYRPVKRLTLKRQPGQPGQPGGTPNGEAPAASDGP
jgi:outer membrane protein assembly factor BamB